MPDISISINAGDWPSWIQALGSLAAIIVAIYISERGHKLTVANEKRLNNKRADIIFYDLKRELAAFHSHLVNAEANLHHENYENLVKLQLPDSLLMNYQSLSLWSNEQKAFALMELVQIVEAYNSLLVKNQEDLGYFDKAKGLQSFVSLAKKCIKDSLETENDFYNYEQIEAMWQDRPE